MKYRYGIEKKRQNNCINFLRPVRSKNLAQLMLKMDCFYETKPENIRLEYLPDSSINIIWFN